MDDSKKIDESSTRRQPPRSGAIELMQLASVLSLGTALWPDVAGGWQTRCAMALAAVILFAVPLQYPQLLERKKSQADDWPHGFKITRWRRQTLAELGVPSDILVAIDDASILNVLYPTGQELRGALCRMLGERVRPWEDLILLHAKFYVDPPSAGKGKEMDARAAGGMRIATPGPGRL